MISNSEITILKSAQEICSIADTALDELEESSVAALINNNANMGKTLSVWNKPLSSKLKDKLTGLGYTVIQRKDPDGQLLSDQYLIRAIEGTE